MQKNPNLLFLFTDQQRYDTLRVYGNDRIKTPNLNRLSEGSAVFKRAYVTQPVCTPSRASLLTGLYPHNNGCIENNIALVPEIPTMVEMISDSRYKTAYMGKWHLGDETIKQHGFDEWVSTEEYRKSLTKEEYRSTNSSYYNFLYDNGFKPDIEGEGYMSFSRHFSTRLPEQFSKPAFTAAEAIRFIEKNRENPFLLYVNFLEPHPPHYSAFDDLYDPEEIELPPCFNAEPGEHTPLKYRFNRRFQRDVGRHFPMKDERAWRKLIARYWGAISLVDKYVGSILDALKENGVEENTIVVFTSDHGDMMGDFRMGQKSVMYESAVRVPFLLRIPGVTDRQITIEKPVSHIDVVPTLLETAGLDSKAKLEGSSLLPLIEGKVDNAQRDVFIEWQGDEGEDKWFRPYRDGEYEKQIDKVYGASIRTIVSQDGWKLSLSEAGEHELYDLNRDPHELHNLYFVEGSTKKKEELKARLLKWQRETGDTVT